MRDLRVDHRVQLNESLEGPATRRASACGKAILLGEHFVVHGVPAIAVPVSGRRVTVTVEATREPGGHRVPVAAEALIDKMLSHLGVTGVRVRVDSNLPIAAGLGSSAALAVALVRALGETDPARVREGAHALEVLAHGTPSGIDDAVATYERALHFEAGHFTWLEGEVPPLWIATVPRTRSTREAVAAVRAFRDAQPSTFASLSRMTADVVRAALDAWRAHDHAALGRCLNEAHAGLRALGVVDPRQETLVDAARAAGAFGAKLTGAGFGGAVLVLAPPRADFTAALCAAGATDVFCADPAGGSS